MKITSAGVIRNEDQPRTGVMSGHRLADWVFDDMYVDGIDLAWEEAHITAREEIRAENPDMSDDDLDVAVEEALEHAEVSGSYFLFGAWKRTEDGRYEIDRAGGDFAATYSSDSNIVCVEWSKHTAPCHHTSPCYIMADGSGPCGDLDTPGDSVIAYTLPPDYLSE